MRTDNQLEHLSETACYDVANHHRNQKKMSQDIIPLAYLDGRCPSNPPTPYTVRDLYITRGVSVGKIASSKHPT
jgi:hypothetical protein